MQPGMRVTFTDSSGKTWPGVVERINSTKYSIPMAVVKLDGEDMRLFRSVADLQPEADKPKKSRNQRHKRQKPRKRSVGMALPVVGGCGCQRARVTPAQCGCDCNRTMRPTGRMTVVPCRTNACGASTALWPLPVTEWNSTQYVLAGPPTVAGGSYGVRWTEFNRRDQLVTKEKDFPSEAKRAAFVKKLEAKDNFNSILAWSDPRDEEPEPPVVGGGFGGFSVPLGTVDMGLLSAAAFHPRGGQIDPVTWQPGMAPGHVRIPGYYTSPVGQEQWGQTAPTWGSAAAVAASLNRAYVGWPWSQLSAMLMRQWPHLQWTPVAEGSAEAQQAGTSPGKLRVVVLGDGRISRFVPG